jgi:uncharacterized damage-inducible protein DinB
MKAHFERFARYNRWANRRIYTAVAQLDSVAFDAPRSGFFPSIAKTLNHILVGDRTWMSRFEGMPQPHKSLDESPHPDFQALDAAREVEDQRIIRYTRTLTEDRLVAALQYKNMAGEAKVTPLDITLTHFFNHQTHHRGQAHAIITACGQKTGDTDLFLVVPEVV